MCETVELRRRTCADIMADALHGNDGISYSATLKVPHHTFDPTMHLHRKKTRPGQP